MSNFELSDRSMNCLNDVHPDLKEICFLAITLTETDFGIYEGLRTLERQKELVAKGASQTLKSRHIGGFAIDLYPYIAGKAVWKREAFLPIVKAFKEASQRRYGFDIEWGGDWESFIDCPHFQLPHDRYPD